MGFAAITRITEGYWIPCSIKNTISFDVKPGDNLDLKTVPCSEVLKDQQPLAVDHAEKDIAFSHHPVVTLHGLQSYITVPILLKNGDFFGTLCAFDRKPAKLNNEAVIGMFKLYADLISFHFDALGKDSSQHIREKDNDSEQLEEVIGILGHDLKNPVATARMSSEILLKLSNNEIFHRHARMIKGTSYRMENMIENLLDFTKSKIGLGIHLRKEINQENLEKTLLQSIKQGQAISPQREIRTDILLEEPVNCDTSRIGQLFSNLFEYADRHADAEISIKVVGRSKSGEFFFSISHCGEERPELNSQQIFEAFYKDGGNTRSGLSLYISSEIARAHNGVIKITSTGKETAFTFRMPASL